MNILNQNYTTWIIMAVVVFLAAGAYLWSNSRHDTVIVKSAAITNPVQVAKALDVSVKTGEQIVAGIEKAAQKPPYSSWTVPARDTQEAAKMVEKQIKDKTAPVLPVADKTIITPQETKVDVYRITLDKPWEVGIGYGNHNGTNYIPVEIQRNYGKNRALAIEAHVGTLGGGQIIGWEVKHKWRF